MYTLTPNQSEDESDAEKQDVKKEEDQKESTDQKTGNAPKATTAALAALKSKTASDSKVNNLKRPGSPNLSELESSGNESSRKRVKKLNTGSVQNSRASTPVPGPQNGIPRPKKIGGATSDGEATGAEMSDAGRKFTKKIKLVSGSHGKGTPTGSRAGSPVPTGEDNPSCLCYLQGYIKAKSTS